MDLFNDTAQPAQNSLKKFLLINDKKGAIKYLNRISDLRFRNECLEAGFSILGNPLNKREKVAYVANQIINL